MHHCQRNCTQYAFSFHFCIALLKNLKHLSRYAYSKNTFDKNGSYNAPEVISEKAKKALEGTISTHG